MARLRTAQGQSLVEVVVVIAVVILLITGLLAGTTTALRSTQVVRKRSQAVKFAQEGLELARSMRNAGWTSFFQYSSGQPTARTWCINKDGIWSESVSGSCPINIDNNFTRTLVFEWQDPIMKVTATVQWTEGSQTYQSVLITYLTEWK